MFKSDKHSEHDLLGREDFAKEIAKNLVYSFKNESESLVIGITGKWGSGKTTFCEFIKQNIAVYQKEKGDRNYIVFDFNAWMFSGQQELQKKFLSQLYAKIGDSNEYFRKVFEALHERTGFFTKFFTGHKYIDLASKILEILSKEQALVEIKNAIEKGLLEKEYKVFVFIDDIDRLNKDEIAEMFQLIKLNASIKNIFYIVSFDKEYVESALVKKYGEGSEKYLEKIVQIDYALPEILEEKLDEIFFTDLKNFIDEFKLPLKTSDVEKIWKYRGLKDVIKTVRDINRYFNALRLRLPTIYMDVDIIDFMLLEAVRVFDGKTYATVLSYFQKNPYDRSKGKLLTEIKETSSQKPIRSIIEYLELAETYRYQLSYTSDKRLIDPRYSDNYFSLALASKSIAEEEIKRFINVPNARRGMLDDFLAFGRLKYFLDVLCNPKLYERYSVEGTEILTLLIGYFDRREIEIDEYHTSLYKAILSLANDSTDGKVAYTRLCEIIEHSKQFSISVYLVSRYIVEDFVTDQRTDYYSTEGRQIIKRKINEIEQSLTTQVKSWGSYMIHNLKSNERSKIFGILFICDFAKRFKEMYLKEIQDKVMFDDVSKARLIKGIVSIWTSNRDTELRFDFKYKDVLFPDNSLKDFYKGVEAIDIGGLEEEDKRMVEFFLSNLPKDLLK